MGAAFRPEVLTGARRTLNLVVAPVIRCLAGDPATSLTESRAEEATIKNRAPETSTA